MSIDRYNEDYYLRGKETGVSLYTDYRWLPDLTVPMAEAIAGHMGFKAEDTVLDYGCARGYLVKALRQLGYVAEGYDPSEWAVANCDVAVAEVVTHMRDHITKTYNWVIAKDVLEHVPFDYLEDAVQWMGEKARDGIFVVVPLSSKLGLPYVVPDYEADVTHSVRWPLLAWNRLLRRVLGSGWIVGCQYRVPGVKDNYCTEYPTGNGFLKALRVK